MKLSPEDAAATRRTELLAILTPYTYWTLTPELIEQLTEQLEQAITKGPCSWAFREISNGPKGAT